MSTSTRQRRPSLFIAFPSPLLWSLWFDGCSCFRLSPGGRLVLATTVVRRLHHELFEQHTPRVDHGHGPLVRGIALGLALDRLATPRTLGTPAVVRDRRGGGLLGLAFHASSPSLFTRTCCAKRTRSRSRNGVKPAIVT